MSKRCFDYIQSNNNGKLARKSLLEWAFARVVPKLSYYLVLLMCWPFFFSDIESWHSIFPQTLLLFGPPRVFACIFFYIESWHSGFCFYLFSPSPSFLPQMCPSKLIFLCDQTLQKSFKPSSLPAFSSKYSNAYMLRDFFFT